MIDIFKAFLLTSAIGTALAIILTLFKPITRKLFSGSWHYYIWLVVLLVMIFPIKLTLPQASEVPQKTEIVNTHLEKSEEAQAPITNTPLTIVENTQPIQTEQSTQPKAASVIEKAINYMNSFSIVFSYIWIIGAVALLLFRLFNYFIFILRLHKYTEVISCPEVAEYTNRNITTRVSEKISSPLIIGVFRPTLLLPKTSLTQEQLHNILSHETTHLKRNDLVYKWFVSFVKCFCWYNPAVYLIGRQINIDCEISCDLAVVEKMTDTEKKSYIETILALLTHNNSKVVPLTTGMAGNKKILKRRFAMIKKPFKISKKTMIISIVLAIVILGISVLASGILNGKLFDIYKNETIELNTDERNGNAFNTLILGVDEQNRADTIMLVMVAEDKTECLSIPRDTVFEGKKISEILAQENGNQNVIDSVRQELSIPITYYAKVNIDFIKDLIDCSGGTMEVDVPMDMKYDDPYKDLHIDLKLGKQILDSESVCNLLRYRRSNNGEGYEDGDLGRIRIGQQVIGQLISTTNLADIVSNSKEMIYSMNKNVETNYSIKNIISDKDIIADKEIIFDIIPFRAQIKNGMRLCEIEHNQFDSLYRDIFVFDNDDNVLKYHKSVNVLQEFFMAFSKGKYGDMKELCTDYVWNTYYKEGKGFCDLEIASYAGISIPTSLKGDNYFMYEVKLVDNSNRKNNTIIFYTWRFYLEKQENGKYLISEVNITLD